MWKNLVLCKMIQPLQSVCLYTMVQTCSKCFYIKYYVSLNFNFAAIPVTKRCGGITSSDILRQRSSLFVIYISDYTVLSKQVGCYVVNTIVQEVTIACICIIIIYYYI